MANPYFSPDKFDLKMLAFDQPDMSYEYNTLVFWATKDGCVYSASDSGCSCPIPFENYESDTLDQLLPQLERVGSVEQAVSIFNSWDGSKYLQQSDRNELESWIKGHIK